VSINSECIETTHSRDEWGYGRCFAIRFGKRISRTHVLAWIDAHGVLPPPETPIIRHTCDNPGCDNPEHQAAGTHADNMRDQLERGRHPNQQKTHCIRDHELAGDNLIVKTRADGREYRNCRICRNEQAAAAGRRKRAAGRAA
jgi:hypothetical protein